MKITAGIECLPPGVSPFFALLSACSRITRKTGRPASTATSTAPTTRAWIKAAIPAGTFRGATCQRQSAGQHQGNQAQNQKIVFHRKTPFCAARPRANKVGVDGQSRRFARPYGRPAPKGGDSLSTTKVYNRQAPGVPPKLSDCFQKREKSMV